MADFLRGLLSPQQGMLAQPEQPSVWGALRDPQFYSDVGSRLAELLRSGVQDVVPQGTRTQRLADMLGTQRDPNYLQKMTDMGLAGMTVFHGSPYKFDKFDMSKIGTGEGAQAYGHGLYLAESPEVAKQYQKTLSADGFLVGDKVFNPSTLGHLNVRSAARTGDIDAAIAKAQEIASSNSPVADLAANDLKLLLAAKSNGSLQKNTGSLYRVDLPDEHIAKMLDWDKPLSQQSEAVQKALGIQNADRYKQIQIELGDLMRGGGMDSPRWNSLTKEAQKIREFSAGVSPLDTGEDLYKALSSSKGGHAGVSAYLNSLGIPGIRYLDGGSRAGGKGTSNFVVFDDQLPKIIGRE